MNNTARGKLARSVIKNWRYYVPDILTFIYVDLVVEYLKEQEEHTSYDCIHPEWAALLLKTDYTYFSTKLDFNNIPPRYIIRLFISDPEVYHEHLRFDRLSKKVFNEVAAVRPDAFEKYDLPFNKLGIIGWENLIEYDAKYKKIFMENLQFAYGDPTAMRKLIYKDPAIIPKLTLTTIMEHNMSAKQWVNLLNSPSLKKNTHVYSDEVQEWLQQELTTEILIGKSTTSRRLNNALGKLRD